MIDAGGKYVTPGIIDSHSHIALDDDVNEATSPITPQMMMMDAFDYQDKAIYRGLAGGVTTSLLLHGSANMIGGQAVVIKHKYGAGSGRDAISRCAAVNQVRERRESEARVRRRGTSCPRHGWEILRCSARRWCRRRITCSEWDNYNAKVKRGDKDAKAPKHDLKLEALADVLRGKLMVQIHCYRGGRVAQRDGDGEGVRIQDSGLPSRARGVQSAGTNWRRRALAIATFADWWGYKQEAWDAIPWNAVISMRKGVRVAIKSDSEDFARRLNQEAAKTMRYGGATEEEALKMITSIRRGSSAWMITWDRSK